MDLSNGKRLIGDLKSKLGLTPRQDARPYEEVYEDEGYYDEGYYDEGYADDYGDGYADYSEFDAYGQGYADDGYDYDDGYEHDDRRNAGTRARSVGREGGYDSRRSSRTRGVGTVPRLLSMDEVRERTRAVAYPPRETTSSGSFAEERTARASAPLPRRSDSFASAPIEPAFEQVEGHSGRFLSLLDAEPGSANGDVSRIRALTVLKPTRYAEAERITEVLKKEDVAVLDLRGAAKGLDKRILDFSFGAASVLDASVECVADKVFVVCAGGGLTAEERTQLQAQGVI